MRDCYNRITPNFEEWEKLGWVCTEVHEQTFTLSRPNDYPLDFDQIVFELNEEDKTPRVWKENISLDGCRKLDFTPDEQLQVNKDIQNYYEEIKNNLEA